MWSRSRDSEECDLGEHMTSLLLLLALLAQQSAGPRGNAENGKALFTKIGCYQCHGREGQGAPATGPRLNQNPMTYTRFVSYIRKPTGEMPPYTERVVSAQQAADLYAFL